MIIQSVSTNDSFSSILNDLNFGFVKDETFYDFFFSIIKNNLLRLDIPLDRMCQCARYEMNNNIADIVNNVTDYPGSSGNRTLANAAISSSTYFWELTVRCKSIKIINLAL